MDLKITYSPMFTSYNIRFCNMYNKYNMLHSYKCSNSINTLHVTIPPTNTISTINSVTILKLALVLQSDISIYHYE